MIKKRKNKKLKSQLAIIGFLLIIISLVLYLGYSIYYYYSNKYNKILVENYFISESNITTNDDNQSLSDSNENNDIEDLSSYDGILEIPSIDLKRGFYNIGNKNNKVNKNIQVLNESSMPNVENSMLVIAGHSGSSNKAFFNKIYKLKNNDYIYVYYQNVKYVYQVEQNISIEKDGTIELQKYKYQTIVLTTCDMRSKKKQVVVVAKLTNKIDF